MRLDLCFSLSRSSIIEFMKSKCLRTKSKKKRRQAQEKRGAAAAENGEGSHSRGVS
jgi:hypothetical protein